jgi:hypothetical protein
MFFHVKPWTRVSTVLGTSAIDVTVVLNSMLRQVEQAAASESPIHLAMEGPFHATSDQPEMILSLHTSGLVFRDTMRPRMGWAVTDSGVRAHLQRGTSRRHAGAAVFMG